MPCLATFALFPHPPVCAPPLSGAPETVTPSDTSMSVLGREWHQYVGVCDNSSEKGEGGERGFEYFEYFELDFPPEEGAY